MNISRKAFLPLLLVGVYATSFPAIPDTMNPTAADVRIPIRVTDGERNQVLFEMRELLHGLFNIHNALARNDMNAVAIAARPLGPVLGRMPEGMRDKLPLPFLEMSMGQQEIFDAIARDALVKGDRSHTLSQMAEAMTYCSGCHDTYRFHAGRPGHE